jgi:RHS repeat-associated protein
VTRYRYDNLGNLVEVRAGFTEESGAVPAADDVEVQKTAVFDDFGRALTETDALGRTWHFEYDGHGNLTKATDPKGQIVTRTYGYGGLVETLSAYRYDGDPAPIVTTYGRNALGQLTRAEAPEIAYTYGYDSAHRLTRVADARAGTYVDYLYSPGGLMDAQVDDQDRWTRYLYDPVGRLAGVWAHNDDLAAFLYDAAGRLQEKWFLSGVNSRYEYRPDGSLSRVVNRAPGGTVVSQHDYTYDAAGNRETHVEQIGGVSRTYRYVYDALDRLREVRDDADGGLIEGYGYDEFDNRVTRTNAAGTLAYVYDAAHQLKEVRESSETGPLRASFEYDDNGNLVQKAAGSETLSLVYDALDRLVEAQRTGFPLESYRYDPDGRRIEKSVGGDTTRFVYSGSDIVAEVGSDWATPRALYTHGPGIDDPLVRTDDDGGALYYHRDGLGSSVAVSDQTGTTAATARYDAFGQVVEATGAIPRYGYTGREPDATGLVYYRARYYDPSVGRFTQRDPAGAVDGVNRYAYAVNNPVNFTDPLGLAAWNPSYDFILSSEQAYYSSSSTRGRQDLQGMQTMRDVEPVADGLDLSQGSVQVACGPALPLCVGIGARALLGASALAVGTGIYNSTTSGRSGGGGLGDLSGGSGGQLDPNDLEPRGRKTRSDPLDARDHHIATNKHDSYFTPRFREIFDRAGISMNDPVNRMNLNLELHNSAHSHAYNEMVLSRLSRATEGLRGEAAAIRLRAELNAIRLDVYANPQILRGIFPR